MTDQTEAVSVEQDRRRAALVERMGTVTDLLASDPLPGPLGDVAYELLIQGAAQIASDRKRLSQSPLPVDEARVEATGGANQLSDQDLIRRLNAGVMVINHEPGREPMYLIVLAEQAMREAAKRLAGKSTPPPGEYAGLIERLRERASIMKETSGIKRATTVALLLKAATAIQSLTQAVAKVREEVIEECAKVAEARGEQYYQPTQKEYDRRDGCYDAAAAIRALKTGRQP